MHKDRKQNAGFQDLGTGALGELLNGCIILILQDEKRSKDWVYNNVNVLNITELYIFKWLINSMCILSQLKTIFFKVRENIQNRGYLQVGGSGTGLERSTQVKAMYHFKTFYTYKRHPRYFHLHDCYKSPSLAVVITVVSLKFVLKQLKLVIFFVKIPT